MKVVFNTWPAAFFQKGGGEVQVEKSLEFLQKLNVDVSKYDMWNPQREQDILHHFSMIEGAFKVIEAYKAAGSKICISPILWPTGQNHELSGKPYVRHCFHLADKIFTNSNMESDLLAKFYETPIEKFHKTRNGVDPFYFVQSEENLFRNKYQVPGDFVLSIANIDRRKNTKKLVSACTKLGLKLVSIGHIKDPGYYNEFSASKNLIQLGPIEDVEMLKSASKACQLFALPSLCETPGLAALEAGSQGCKIVITSEGSTREYFEDHVTYVDPLSEDSIVNGLERELAMNRDLIALQDHMKLNYSWEMTALDILKGYKKVLNP